MAKNVVERLFLPQFSYILEVEGLIVTRSLVRFSLISALTPIAEKYSSKNILMKSFDASETKTRV